ncbi:MAG: WS/DGAT domain-containing protein [Candidatus Nanopelagicales bacterium]|nr:WS/DGAT domain-containing protein [Candidatus Nanopelagicales bacterium]
MATTGALVPLSPGDLDTLTVDVGPAPANLAVVLELPDVTADQAPAIAAVLGDRIRAVPSLWRAIHRDGHHLFWVEHDAQPDQHLRIVDIQGDALLHAGHLLTQSLDLAEPPWHMTLLVGDRGVSIVFVAHHVLTDGLHGLAMLASLADAPNEQRSQPSSMGPPPSASSRSRPLPRRRHLPRLAPRTSLNRPTGPDRVISTHDIALDALSSAAHEGEATINDLLLVAISEAVAGELRRRGEYPPELRVWVPVATGAGAALTEAGNAVGVMLVPVDLLTSGAERLAAVSAYTKQRKPGARQPQNLRIAHAISQATGRLGIARMINQHQRIGNTSLSTMRGPTTTLRLAGHPIRRIVPAASRAANIGVNFIALSYAGTMTISVVHDPAQLPDPEPLLADLAAALVRRMS